MPQVARRAKTDQEESDFRVQFYELGPGILITGAQFAELLCITHAAFNAQYHAGKIPNPVIRQPRFVRWRVSDVRAWLESLEPVPARRDRMIAVPANRVLQ
jgi:predicted DNA-binding transcriptional regulator AlpA